MGQARQTTKRKSGRPANPLSQREILALARPVIAERGVDGVSIREVAELAGIRKASLYHHFESKQALYKAMMDDVVESLLGLVSSARLDEGDFVTRLDRLGHLGTAYFATHPEVAGLLMRELIGEGDYLAQGGDERVQATLESMAAFLQAGMDAGAFRRSDPRQLALSLAGLHILPFAARRMTETFLKTELSSPDAIAERQRVVLEQARLLCTGKP